MTPLPDTAPDITVTTLLADTSQRTLADDVLAGLSASPKTLPPKHFYDSVGAELFDQICDLPEYYPTRAEREILVTQSAQIAQLTGATELVELGAGSADKTRVLLTALSEAGTLDTYVPMDVAEQQLRQVCEAIADEYPGLKVHGVAGDFLRHMDAVPASEGPRVVALLGGTVGNFIGADRADLLAGISAALRPNDYLLLGTDLVKDRAPLEAAYDDSQGVTAAFNRNVLQVINRELDADFDPNSFEHIALYNEHEEQIEMRLRSTLAQEVTIQNLSALKVVFEAGEEILTEVSAKFTPERLEQDLAGAGLELAWFETDSAGQFALSLSHPQLSP